MKNTNDMRVQDTLLVYLNQAFNLTGLVDPFQFYKFTEELSSDEYLLLDYLIYQGMKLSEATLKLEVSLYKGKCLLDSISNKARKFVANMDVVIYRDDCYEYKCNTNYSFAA